MNIVYVTDVLSTELPREATSDRITLGVTAVLTLSAISLDSRSDLPKVEYSRRKTIGEKEGQKIRANLEYVVIFWVEIFVYGQHPPQQVHYATALDWFIICSFLYCMASILEFAGVHYFTKVALTTITIDTNFLRSEVGNPLETTAWS